MKIAITGKGGVGKTTMASLLSKAFAASGYSVLAIDANPDPNLAMALGVDPSVLKKLVPVSQMEELIEERTGAKPGASGAYFKLNPRVDDIPDRFSIALDGIRLLYMGTVERGGGGCICPESTMLKMLTTHLVLRRSEVVVMDMDAGFEHVGRGTASGVDAFIVVVEPGQRSLQTARAIQKLAGDIGVSRVFVVGSKTKSDDERAFIRDNLPGFQILGFLDYNPKIGEADLKGVSVYEYVPEAAAEANSIKEQLIALQKKGERAG
ncbi:MAG: AAA family ATPase [Chloroflexi bacterium]|nr:AAA family ATPase [Chloroflexota bacterium]